MSDKRTAYNHMYIGEDENGNSIWGNWDDYFAMKGYSNNSEEPTKISKKKPFWKFW